MSRALIPFLIGWTAIIVISDRSHTLKGAVQSSEQTVAVEDDVSQTESFVVIGVIVDGIYSMPGNSGVHLRIWRPASDDDYREFLMALRVPEEYRPVFEEIIDESKMEDRRLIDEESPIMLREAFAASHAAALRVRAYKPEEAPSRTEVLRKKTFVRQETRRFLNLRAKNEQNTLDRIVARCDDLGIALDQDVRTNARRLFEAGRWRARCSDVSPLVSEARIDLGLVALPYVNAINGTDEQRIAKRVVQQYWKEITPSSKQFVESQTNGDVDLEMLAERTEAAPRHEREKLYAEKHRRSREMGAPLFKRVEANMQWLPKIAETLPEASRRSFIWQARELMFPQIPTERGIGLDTLIVAKNFSGLDESELSTFALLIAERSNGIEALNQKMEAAVIRRDKAFFALGENGSKDQYESDLTGLLMQRVALEEKIVTAVRGILTAEQVAKLPQVKSPPIPQDPFTVQIPLPVLTNTSNPTSADPPDREVLEPGVVKSDSPHP